MELILRWTKLMIDFMKREGVEELSIGFIRVRLPSLSGSSPTRTSPPTEENARGIAEQDPRRANVLSPIVGIAYLCPEPGAAPFVRIDELVSEGQTLLRIEAMKVMNEIKATHSGRVARIFVEDAEPVEYGAELMLIE